VGCQKGTGLGQQGLWAGLLHFMTPSRAQQSGLEQSFNYNAMLYNGYESIAELFADVEAPECVERLKHLALHRTRLLNNLRMASGTMPSVGNNSYGSDLRETNQPGDTFHDPLAAQILDTLLYENEQQLEVPAYTSIAIPAGCLEKVAAGSYKL
jgi:hypothetical protein